MSSNGTKKPKKRGRKSKKEKEALLKAQQEAGNIIVEKKPKKRGRKPKGGKIIKAENISSLNNIDQKQNIILHLKCSSKDKLICVRLFLAVLHDDGRRRKTCW